MASNDLPREGEQMSAHTAGQMPDPGRRRWLAGMLAGPAVVSLPRTASAAMGSIATCIENYNDKLSIPYHVGYEGLDQYARERVPGVCAFKGGGQAYREQMLIETGSGELIDPEYNIWRRDGFNKITAPDGTTWKTDSTMVVPDRYRMVFGVVGPDGQWLTDNYEIYDAMPVTRSCYASISPTIM
ncbi:MAG: hypothetical protein PVH91_07075 [Pseudomonadales bacterium]|jgi:hypothetical protein